MVDLNSFYRHVNVDNRRHLFVDRVQPLLDEIIRRLPDEPQFLNVQGNIFIGTRDMVIEYWEFIHSTFATNVNFREILDPDNNRISPDGYCQYPLDNDQSYAITIIVDRFNEQTDNYIRGVIAHEFSEFSLAWNTFTDHRDELQSDSISIPNPLDSLLNNVSLNSAQYHEHERRVNEEARRLGFQEEIDALEQNTNTS